MEKKFTWKFYITAEALLTAVRIKLINKKEFAKMVLDENSETFVVNVAFFNLSPGIHSDRAAQIAFLLAKKVRIPDKYWDFANIFSEKKVLVLSKCTKFNKHAINWKNSKQPPYKPIYSLGPVELEILKTYIKTHLQTRFIWPSKPPVNASILFDKKPDGSFCLCIDYQDLNNFTIKN